ncbi:MAG: glycosyltransferase family 4 protein [Anaerolineales bacterium]|nr:glycosyltransferase family 4 protein [Anaerolineales bacterium]
MARIGIDYTAAVQQAAGIGRYVRELFRALLELDTPHQYKFFAASPSPIPPAAQLPIPIKRLPFHDKWLMRIWHRARLPIPVEVITGPVDLFHSPDFTLPPTKRSTRTLLTVHDLSFIRQPESTNQQLMAYLNQVVPRSVQRADHVLADSQATKDDLIELWQTPPEKISVLYCGVEERFHPITKVDILQETRKRYQLGDNPFILSVGTLHPRKNFPRLVQAFSHLTDRYPDITLVIAGGKSWHSPEILAEPARLGITGRVIFPGFIADSDLPALYSAAEMFVLPSLYEGFGIPVLEAMSCGTAVAISNRPSLPEVAGGAAIIFDALDLDGMASAMEKVLTDSMLRSKLIDKGIIEASKYTWQKSACQLSNIYQRLINN